MPDLGDALQAAMFFKAVAGRISGYEQEGLAKAAKIVEDGAKQAIGTYSFGWPALAAETVARKGADTPLLETGALRDSITHEVEPHRAIVGSSDEKAAWMEHGTSRGIPPRPFIGGAARQYAGEIEKAVAGAVMKAFEGST